MTLILLSLVACRSAVSADFPSSVEVVLSVVDGDTIRVERPNQKSQLIRLVGIDAPERRINRRAEKKATRGHVDLQKILRLGESATKFLQQKLPRGSKISVEYDIERRDHYGRLLGYVYLADGTFVNLDIVSSGYAHLLTVPPNIRYEKRFREAYRQAREAGRGLWAFPEFDSTGPARQKNRRVR